MATETTAHHSGVHSPVWRRHWVRTRSRTKRIASTTCGRCRAFASVGRPRTLWHPPPPGV